MQHGFWKGRSTVTQLLAVYQDIIEGLAEGKETDIIYLDFSKAFDKVPHSSLISKLPLFGIIGDLLLWFKVTSQEDTNELPCKDYTPNVLKCIPVSHKVLF